MGPPSKTDWRRRATEARTRLTLDDERHREALATFLAARRAERDERGAVGWVVAYRAIAGELDVGPLCDDAGLGPFALTRTPDIGLDLTLHPWASPLERHRYGFDQPVADAPLVADADVSIVLVPGLAFDRRGARLGRGVGFYDRFLARLDPSVVLVGVTAGYLVAELPTEPHDVAMTHLCGEFGVLPTPLDEPEE